ncbi:hypothetical protein HY625_02330 [Candidatus Uhrbacteria bacterium]|nr:hypothetical protein [Candidatus Uhrbacteria bacterium]
MQAESIRYIPLSVKEILSQPFSTSNELRDRVFLRIGGSPVALCDYDHAPPVLLLHIFDAIHHSSLECVTTIGNEHVALFSHAQTALRPSAIDMRFILPQSHRAGERREDTLRIDLHAYAPKKKGIDAITASFHAFAVFYGSGVETTVLHGAVPPLFLLLAAHYCYGKTETLLYEEKGKEHSIFSYVL